MWSNPQYPRIWSHLLSFIEKILDGKLNFSCIVSVSISNFALIIYLWDDSGKTFKIVFEHLFFFSLNFTDPSSVVAVEFECVHAIILFVEMFHLRLTKIGK